MSIISTTVLPKTGTKIIKLVKNGTCLGMNMEQKCLQTTVEFASNSPMVEKFGIKEMFKYKSGNNLKTTFKKENGTTFSLYHNKNGEVVDYSDSVRPLLGSNMKETLKNIFNALNFAKR